MKNKQTITLSANAHRALSILIVSSDLRLYCREGYNFMGEPLGFVRFIGTDRSNISRHRAGMSAQTAMELIRNRLVVEKFTRKTRLSRGGRLIGWFLNKQKIRHLLDKKQDTSNL